MFIARHGQASPCLLFRIKPDGLVTVEAPGSKPRPVPWSEVTTLAALAQLLQPEAHTA